MGQPDGLGAKRNGRGSWTPSLGLFTLLLLIPAVAAAQSPRLGPEGLRQLEALRAEKAARLPHERKISSHLLHAAREERGELSVPGAPELRLGRSVVVDAAGLTEVDIEGDVSPGLLAEIAALGGTARVVVPRYGAVRAWIPLARVEDLARRSDVRSLRPADLAMTNVVSQGDVAHRADVARQAFGVDGTGVSIGVLSNGVDTLAARQAAGELPGVTVLPGQSGAGDEGTAMLEIVHDLAPGAALFFATAFGSQAGFAQNILDLENAGADIIVDDVFYFAEGVFQDDNVAEAVNSVTASGARYFSSAGNAGNLNDVTAGVWQGDFVDSGSNHAGGDIHDFGGGDTFNRIAADTTSYFTLQWSDPLDGSGNDYDLYLWDASQTSVIDSSTSNQNGNDDPFEFISSIGRNDVNNYLMIVRDSGAARYLHLNANRGRLGHTTDGQISGHAAAADAFAVAAVNHSQSGPGGVFDGSEPVEPYSSDGPRRIFYQGDGAPITPGDFLSTGGVDRAKPDLAAADCVYTTTPGFFTFCGTSAAAPHAAAIAALVLEADAGADVRAALEGTALDIEAPGHDRDSGAGIADAQAAVAEVLGDADADAWPDAMDNCAGLANPAQIDTDSDGYGNACDPDYDNDGIADGDDFTLFRSAWGTSLGQAAYNPAIDVDGDDAIGGDDFNFFRDEFAQAPGPSGLSCAGTIPCP